MTKIIGTACPHLPWQDRPANWHRPIWRDTGNPIIRHNQLKRSNSIFNSAVVPFQEGFAGVFRCDDIARHCRLHAGFSKDGIHWQIDESPIQFESSIPFEYGYDPRVCRIEDRWYVTWCNGMNGEPTIGLAETTDFRRFRQMENAFLPYNRNGVLFPRRINGMYVMLSRPSDNGATPFGDIYLSRSPDLHYWGDHRLVMRPVKFGWQSTKIGAGPVPVETDAGWLLIYHGVLTSCNGLVYAFGAALLDLDDPSKVIKRTPDYLLAPEEPYERVGDVPNVVFPCATLHDSATGRIAIYYGCADTCVGIAYGYLDDMIAEMQDAAQ